MASCSRTSVAVLTASLCYLVVCAISGWGRSFRQTIMLGPYATPDANALFRQECNSLQGRVRLTTRSQDGVVKTIATTVRQLFLRIPRDYGATLARSQDSEIDPDEERFAYFTVRTFAHLRSALQLAAHTSRQRIGCLCELLAGAERAHAENPKITVR